MKKQIVSLLIALMLCVTGTALAAPLRDEGEGDVLADDSLRALLSVVLGAANLKDVTSLEEGQTPPAGLVEAALGLGIHSRLLPYGGDAGSSVALSEQEAAEYCAMLFTQGEYALPAQSDCKCVVYGPDSVTFDLETLESVNSVTVHVYDSVINGDTAVISADVMTHFGAWGVSPKDVPEMDAAWLFGAKATLKSDDMSPYGYTVSAFELTDLYAAGALDAWPLVENAEAGYSVSLPDNFLRSGGTAQDAIFITQDGAATLRITAAAATGSLEEYKQKEFPDDAQMSEFGYFTVTREGRFVLCVLPDGGDTLYTLEMTFPAQRQQEFTLYADFIRNSFSAQGQANG